MRFPWTPSCHVEKPGASVQDLLLGLLQEQPKQESDCGQNAEDDQAEVDTQAVPYSRTIRTGQWACLTTESETLPIKARLTPPNPLLPMMIKPAPISSLR
jgi:hypothetical protein